MFFKTTLLENRDVEELLLDEVRFLQGLKNIQRVSVSFFMACPMHYSVKLHSGINNAFGLRSPISGLRSTVYGDFSMKRFEVFGHATQSVDQPITRSSDLPGADAVGRRGGLLAIGFRVAAPRPWTKSQSTGGASHNSQVTVSRAGRRNVWRGVEWNVKRLFAGN